MPRTHSDNQTSRLGLSSLLVGTGLFVLVLAGLHPTVAMYLPSGVIIWLLVGWFYTSFFILVATAPASSHTTEPVLPAPKDTRQSIAILIRAFWPLQSIVYTLIAVAYSVVCYISQNHSHTDHLLAPHIWLLIGLISSFLPFTIVCVVCQAVYRRFIGHRPPSTDGDAQH